VMLPFAADNSPPSLVFPTDRYHESRPASKLHRRHKKT
jgi:hypothetical protein